MNSDDHIDEAALGRLIPAFYDRVRADPEIGPLFDEAVDDWPAHLPRDVRPLARDLVRDDRRVDAARRRGRTSGEGRAHRRKS